MTEDELRELQEERYAVAEMMQTPGWSVYRRRLGKLLDGHQRNVMSGNVADMLRYKQLAGEMTAYHRALTLHDEIDRLINDELERRHANDAA